LRRHHHLDLVMSVPESWPASASLTELIASLAVVDDQDAAVRVLLVRIGGLARRELARCDAVSVTYAGDDGVTTVEADPELVRAVDAAQYADDDGPCLRALRDGYPAGGQIDTAVTWPGFRAQSLELGLRGALAAPLFTAANAPVASLNLWSRSPTALDPLRAALVGLFESYAATTAWVAPAGLDPGERRLARGLHRALELHMIINQAVGYLVERHQVSPDEAFEWLRATARGNGTDIARTAGQVLIS
jgi:predicted transcriptional regulator